MVCKVGKLPVRHKSSKLRSSAGDRDGRSGGGQQGRAARAAGGTRLDAPAGLKQTDNWIKQYQHQHCHSIMLVCALEVIAYNRTEQSCYTDQNNCSQQSQTHSGLHTVTCPIDNFYCVSSVLVLMYLCHLSFVVGYSLFFSAVMLDVGWSNPSQYCCFLILFGSENAFVENLGWTTRLYEMFNFVKFLTNS